MPDIPLYIPVPNNSLGIMTRKTCLSLIVIVFSLLSLTRCSRTSEENREWREYLGGPDRNHYSTLTQITPENVRNLKVAWEYHTKDSGQIQCNPLIVDGVLYGITATVQPFALHAATGREIWRVRDSVGTTWYGTARGLVYWEKNRDDKRILYTKESWLHAIDATTGKPVASFGDNGRVSLKAGLGETAKDKFVISNTPGTVYENLIIMPLRVSEDYDAAFGHIQAFNMETGALEWVFKTIPDPGEPGSETWPADVHTNSHVGAANNWAGMAVDRKRGIVYVPTGSAAFDYHGGKRHGSNLYANCLLALDARTGKLKWHFQLVHHDILDRDPPAPPNLATLTINGKKTDAVVQVTKHGYVFIFDRETGQPLFPINEVPVPQSDFPGEQSWPTQPLPVKPLPYARQTLTENDINPYAEDREELMTKFRNSRFEGPFTPLTRQGSIVFPGLDGGAEWGGAAIGPDGIMYVNSSEMAWLISLGEKRNDVLVAHPGEQVYASQCSQCHGSERKGNAASGFPSLVDLNKKYQREHVLDIITKGKGMMPAFNRLSPAEQRALIAFLWGDRLEVEKKEVMSEQQTAPGEQLYRISGFTKFLSKDGYPAIAPPWGTLHAIDLNTGEYRWTKVFGDYPDLRAKGIEQTGSESYGGPVITKSGVLFIAGTRDAKFRAYNSRDGELLWETQLPAAGFATPSTYEADGKQYVVIACGGTKLGAPGGDSYVAFSLE
jgi:quinoprotein glucose dehydrogenase